MRVSSPGLAKFLVDWCHPDFGPDPVEPSGLAEVERALAATLPDSYKSAVLAHGLPHVTLELLDFICDNNIDLPDVSDFHSPEEIIALTTGWREMGMPIHLIAFASDCSGNQFAFSTKTARSSDEVWFFDHDFGDIERIADSFEDWLSSYGALKA